MSDRAADYAVVELARPVTGRSPVVPRVTNGGLASGTPLTLIGFPSGIPVKVDGGGVVRSSIEGVSFRADVDAFSSSSGSGVFDEDGRLVGFLQQGAQDYVANGECNVVNVVEPTADGGERVAYLDLVLGAYCEANASSELCACAGTPCRDAADAGVDAGVDAAVDVGADVGEETGVVDAATDSAVARDGSSLDGGPAPANGGGCSLGASSGDAAWVLMFFAALARRSRRRLSAT